MKSLSAVPVLILGLLLVAPAYAGNTVQVCHIPPDDPANFHTITVSENALPAHLAHGDLLGGCGDSCETLCDDSNACTIDACDADEECIYSPVDCNDSNVCTADSCDVADGCEYAALPGGMCTVDDELRESLIWP